MTDITTAAEHTGSSARITALRDGEEVGELTLYAEGPHTWVANHTHVHASARGRGIAGIMFSRMVEWAREHDFRIIPTCSYVIKKFKEPDAPRGLLADAHS